MAIWDTIASFEYAVWFGCAVFYISDHCKLLTTFELLYEETTLGMWSFRVTTVPYSLFGKELCIINPFLPWLCTFKVSWGTNNSPSGRAIRSERRNLIAFLKSSLDLRLISLFSFISLFAAGPYLTAIRGLTHAILAVVVFNIFLGVFALLTLSFHRKDLKVSRGAIALLVFEGLVCPPYTACLLRRIALNYAISCDGLILAKSFNRTTNLSVAVEYAATKLQEVNQSKSLTEGQEVLSDKYVMKPKS